MLKYENGGFSTASLPENGDKITVCYVRLSHEDLQDGDSNSVVNQRDLLLKYCTEHHFPHVRFFCDGPVKIGLNQRHPTARGALV